MNDIRPESGALPTLFLPHGGGPCFFMDWDPPETWRRMESFLRSVPELVGARPKALLVISGHWEEATATVNVRAEPDLLFDYGGFPAHTYQLTWPAPGSPDLALRVRELLSAAGIASASDDRRGLDHGVFIPLKVAFPDADIPVVQLSLVGGLDPAAHLALGRALAPLRREGVLIVGSGMTAHNMRRFRWDNTGLDPDSVRFDEWLGEAVEAEPEDRERRLTAWATAPGARGSHPREEHLLPLHVVAGAAGTDPGRRVLADRVLGTAQSAFLFGETVRA